MRNHCYRPLGTILVVALAIRLSVWTRIFRDGQTLLDGPDAYYHLRRAALTLEHWPAVPQVDPLLNVPEGGVISWPPLFDFLLASFALPWRAAPQGALEVIGAFLPPLLGLLEILLLYQLMSRLTTRRAAIASALVAAVLPAVVRYTLLGSLDHDPFFELSVLMALSGVARTIRDETPSWRATTELAAGLLLAVLSWAGSLVGIGLVALVSAAAAFSSKRVAAAVAPVVSIGAAAAAIISLPFVLQSEWTIRHRFSFEGLSLLQETGLIALAFVGAAGGVIIRARWRAAHAVIAAVFGFVLVFLLPGSLPFFIQGVRYAAGDAPILEMVAEARPLLFLLGPFDLRALFARLALLPMVFCIMVPLWLIRRHAITQTLFLGSWGVATLTLAFLHARFSFTAAIALAAFAGAAWNYTASRERRSLSAAVALILMPAVAAYVPIPGWQAHNFYAREIALEQYEMVRISRELRAHEGSVLAPWYLGHWVVWLAGKGVVLSPMLSVGQSEFRDGMRFFFLEDPDAAKQFLRNHNVAFLIVSPELGSIETRARVSGVDPGRYVAVDPVSGQTVLNLQTYMRTIAARLTFLDLPLDGYEEVTRSSTTAASPFGPVPLVRVYRIQQVSGPWSLVPSPEQTNDQGPGTRDRLRVSCAHVIQPPGNGGIVR